jgi:hypothetical protein
MMAPKTTWSGMEKRASRGLPILFGLAGFVIAGIAVVLATTGLAAARGADKAPAKTLNIVSVESPTRFEGSNPFPTQAQRGQKLLVVTVAFDRDFKSHLRSSEAGEVFLTGQSEQQRYYTVDTAIEKSAGPGKKPSRRATFVFSVPENAGQFVFHYGSAHAVPLTRK